MDVLHARNLIFIQCSHQHSHSSQAPAAGSKHIVPPRIRAMKKVVLNPRPAARGSVGEVGVRRAKPITKSPTGNIVILTPRPLARGSVGLAGVRRAVPVKDRGGCAVAKVTGKMLLDKDICTESERVPDVLSSVSMR